MPVKSIRKRYLAFKVSGFRNFSKRALSNEIFQRMSDTYDKSEIGERRIKVMRYDRLAGLGIIRCGHRSANEVKSILKGLHTISGRPVAIDVIGISGTIRALKRKYLSF